jgi:uncharacterized membrane protein
MLRASSICLWLGAFVFESGVFCQTYVEFFVAFPPGTLSKETVPTSINERGEIAGYYTVGTLVPHGFVRAADGTITSFDAPAGPGGFLQTFAYSINDAGAITGSAAFADTTIGMLRPRGYVRDPEGNFTTFDPPGSINTQAHSINDGGAIAGYYNEANLVIHGFVRGPNGKITSFDPPDSTSTKAVSINATGTVAGYYQVANMSVHGFVRRAGGTIVSFDPPESTGTIVTAINNAGAITGYYTLANGRALGFVRRAGGTIVSFDAPGSTGGTFPTSINDEGAIPGSYFSEFGHGFIRSPEGVITSFDPPNLPNAPEPLCRLLGPSSFPTSINQEGVITGSCATGLPGLFAVIGWVRYP